MRIMIRFIICTLIVIMLFFAFDYFFSRLRMRNWLKEIEKYFNEKYNDEFKIEENGKEEN